MLKRL
jgi:hypothetical protein